MHADATRPRRDLSREDARSAVRLRQIAYAVALDTGLATKRQLHRLERGRGPLACVIYRRTPDTPAGPMLLFSVAASADIPAQHRAGWQRTTPKRSCTASPRAASWWPRAAAA
jgi:hypothetical protein